MSSWDSICEQLNKKRFVSTPNPWIHPKREEFDSIDVVSSPSSEFPDASAQTYSSTNAFADKNIKKQVRKKKPKKKSKKKKKEDRIVDNE